MSEQTFNSIRWLASEILLRRGALDRLLDDGLEAFMEDCPFDDLTPEQADTTEAVLDNDDAMDALRDFWFYYDEGREAGNIPDARATVAAPWLNGK